DDAERAVVRGQQAFDRLARLAAPTVALVQGTAAGGGCELALACRARVATENARIGLPETKLGILPAWGGSMRLPRLIGFVPAVEIITGGRVLNAWRARRIGLVDSVVPREHLEREGLRLIAEMAAGGAPPRPKPALGHRLLGAVELGRDLVAKKAREKILAETKGFYPAPAAALEVVEAQHGKPAAEGFAAERRAVVELLFGPVARELIRIFRMTRDGSRPPIYAAADAAAPLREVAVIGAGVMGAGIAQVCAARGFATRVIDVVPGSLVRARAGIAAELKKLAERRELPAHEARKRLAACTFSTSLDGLRGVDLVIEAAPERRDLKDRILADASAAMRDDALIATNTSSFALAELARAVHRPERFLGLHFFNPAPKMPLVEVVRGPDAGVEVVERGVKFVKMLGKTPLVTADGPGFLVNRLLAPYFAAACDLAEAGTPIEAIDGDVEAYGFPMGPFTLMDTVGLDVLRDVGEHLGARGRGGVHPLVRRLADAKELGRKTGRGFYVWVDGKKTAPNRERLGVPSTSAAGPHPAGSLARRLVDVMIAEARAALADGLVPTADEVDLGAVFGIGYPAWRGGPLRDAERREGGAS
ncbi:MAG TPA: 3-hydroxyacyl-CoA dehydrogenase NAD-binding domain-containing protein, partial [Planctomycetota bacterium]|nr:3-hydroxyacyl-CoA dehydrogenase NAD-binding domain-containing protein [Planctomycetota bacterium]